MADTLDGRQQAGPSELRVPRTAFMSPTRVDPFYQEGANITSAATFDSRWVTVFGFQAADTAEILRKFQAYGEIVKHKNEGHGNWMHLCYQTKLQAQRALSKNGSVVSGNIMIGVVPCIAPLARLDLGTGSLAQLSRVRRALTTDQTTAQHASVFRSATGEFGVDATGSAPAPVTSFWSKCLEYMFGY
jgi:Nup53/35/40-type RNA recognition motif